MTYIQIHDKFDAKGFLALAKSGFPVVCLPDNIYGVRDQHLKLLRKQRIPFRKLNPKDVNLPHSTLAA